jgi:hypothetical protein
MTPTVLRTLLAMAVHHKQLTVYFNSLEPVRFFEGPSKDFLAGEFPLEEVLETIRKADPAAEEYRIKEDLFGGETLCLVHDDGPAPVLGAYYRDNLSKPLAEYKGEITEVELRDGEALVDAAYAAFFPGDVVGLVRTSSKAPGFAKIGTWLRLISGYGLALFALEDSNTLAQLDAAPTKLRGLSLRIPSNRIRALRGFSPNVAAALRAAGNVAGHTDEVGIELRSTHPKQRPEFARQLRAEIEELMAVLPDFLEAQVTVAGLDKPVNLLRGSIKHQVKVPIIDSKRVGPNEAAVAMFDAYSQEAAAIELAVEATRPRVSGYDPSLDDTPE